MRNKIKKIITSLVLAASLALAPMNVSAEPGVITEKDQTATTNVLASGTLLECKYKLTIPESVLVNLDDPLSPVAMPLTISDTYDFEGRHLEVAPTFNPAADQEDVKIGTTARNNELVDVTVKFANLGIDGELLKFTDEPISLNGSDSGGTGTGDLTFTLNQDKADAVRRNLIGDVVVSADQPKIEKVKVGTISFTCGVVRD